MNIQLSIEPTQLKVLRVQNRMLWEMVIVKPSKSSIIHQKFKKMFSSKMIMQIYIRTNRNLRISNISISKLDKKRYKKYLSIMHIKKKWTAQNLENLKWKTKFTIRANSNKRYKNLLFTNNMAVISQNNMHMCKTQINNILIIKFTRPQSKFSHSKMNLKI
jgi:hypothetical protein